MKSILLFSSFLPGLCLAGSLCVSDPLIKYTWGNDLTDNKIHVDADSSLGDKSFMQLDGNISLKRGQEKLEGSQIDYDRVNQIISSDQTLHYGNPQFALRAQESSYNLESGQGTFKGADYYLTQTGALGRSEKLEVDRVNKTEDLTDASYTTCARDDQTWSIHAKSLYLDHTDETGSAWNATFHIKDVPVFYFPYFSFPLNDDRKSGFLFPTFKSSQDTGADLTLPYYINIAPNQDATLYPRYMIKRGLMLGGEYRYLTEHASGTASLNYLANDLQDDTKRWSFKTDQNFKIKDVRINALYQRVSDKSYIDDFDNTLDLTSDNFLESHLNANYSLTPDYHVFAQVQSYQVSNIAYTQADKPYDRLPRLLGTGEWFYNRFGFTSRSELTNFDKDNFVSGTRFDQELGVSYYLENTYAFLTPKLTYRFTSYDLSDQDEGKDSDITRSIPIISVDSGLYFDRNISWFGQAARQTLEPRLFYLYVPYRDQSDNPDFDTSEIDSSYDWLFLTNRFNGRDLIGDANQLTTAISSTIIDSETGKERAKISIGQIQYFQDRRVSLLDSVSEAQSNESQSNLIAEASLSLNDGLKIRGLVHNDLDQHHTERSLVGASYQFDQDRVINLSHIYDQDFYKQIDFSGIWRFNDSWRAFWRWNYSIEFKKNIDLLAGIEYADCCWSVRLVAREHRENLVENTTLGVNDDPETSIYLEFALHGLGNIGTANTSNLLNEVIPGYQPLEEEQ